MRRFVFPIFTLLIIGILAGSVSAQGFAVSYPPNLTELDISPNEPYEFTITVYNRLPQQIFIEVQKNGTYLQIDVTNGVYVNANSTERIRVRIVPLRSAFEGYIRLIVKAGQSGAVIAGSVTIPIRSKTPLLIMPTIVESNATQVQENSTSQDFALVFNTTKNTTVEEGFNMTGFASFEGGTGAIVIGAQDGEGVSGINFNSEELTSEPTEPETATTELESEAVESPTMSYQNPVFIQKSTDINAPDLGDNWGIFLIIAGIIGIYLGKRMRGESNEEESYFDDYGTYNADYY